MYRHVRMRRIGHGMDRRVLNWGRQATATDLGEHPRFDVTTAPGAQISRKIANVQVMDMENDTCLVQTFGPPMTNGELKI